MKHQEILVFDIETYPDSSLVEATSGIDLAHFREDLKRRTGSDFLPVPYHVPIAIAFLKTDRAFREINVEVHTAVPAEERSLVETFWNTSGAILGMTAEYARKGLLVSFNGTEFDIPVLEMRALKYALQANPLVRDSASHFDIPLFLAHNVPARKRGLHLATLAKLIGLPGKALLNGDQVQATFDEGGLSEIGKYCLLDVLQTYLLYLRCQLLVGMNVDEYETAIRSFGEFLTNSRDFNVRAVYHHFENTLSILNSTGPRHAGFL
jgi:3'-5' exonuclease